MSDKIEVSSQVSVTPKLLAEIFWGMDDTQQCKFFEELSDVIGDSAYGHGEMQWCYLSDRLNENPKAKEMACAMTAWIFVKFMQSTWRTT